LLKKLNLDTELAFNLPSTGNDAKRQQTFENIVALFEWRRAF